MNDRIAPPTLRGVSPITIQEIARNVGKLGELFLSEAELNEINRAQLSKDDVIKLYVYIRDASSRLEDEWRDEFVATFDHGASLPPALT